MKNNRIKRLIICSLVLLITTIFVLNPINVYGAWNNNAIDFVNENGERHALYKENSFWFGQWGTSNGTIKYRIIGWQISVMVSGQKYIVNSKVGASTSVVDERFLPGTNKLYTLWKIDYNTITKKLKQKYPSVNFSELADRTVSSRYKFDAIMTTGIVQSDSSIKNQGDIDDNGVRTSGTVYYDVTGILNAASWNGSAPDEIRNLFDINSTVEGNQKPIVNEEYVPINNYLSVISYDYKENNNVYWVNTNKQFQIYIDGYINSASLIYPDRNILNLFPNGNNNDLGAFATTSSGSNTSNFNNDFTLNSSSTRAWTEQVSSRNYLKANFYLSAKYDNKDYLLNYLSQWKGMNGEYSNSGIWIKTDNTAPTISGKPSSSWTKSDVVMNLTASDNRSGNKSISLFKGTTKVATGTSSLSYTEKNGGIHNFKVVAIDNVGNSREEAFTINIDRTPPVINGQRDFPWVRSFRDLILSGTDNLSGMEKIILRNSNNIEITSGKDSINYRVTKEGITNYKVEATDKVGNKSIEDIIVRIDNTPPVINGPSSYGWTNKDVTILQSVSDPLSGVRVTYFFDEYYNLISENIDSVGYTVSQEGISKYGIASYDNVDNDSSKEITVKIDKTAPTISGKPSSSWTKSDVVMNLTASDDLSGVKSIALFKGTTQVATGISSLSYTEKNEGTHNFKIVATDNAGNSKEEIFAINIDRTAPIGNTLYNFDETTLNLNTTVTDIVENGSGVNKIWVEYYVKENSENIITEILTNNNGIYKGKKDLYNLFGESINIIKARVKAIDNVGNEGTLAEKEFDTFLIKAEIFRVLSPNNPIFKNGEKGILNVMLYGGVEKVKINFPYELSQLDNSLNTEISISPIEKYKIIEIPFFIPLEALENNYTVEVIGYKNGKEKRVYPRFQVLNGSVTDEVRTIFIYPGRDKNKRW